jgi:hypothetical protein
VNAIENFLFANSGNEPNTVRAIKIIQEAQCWIPVGAAASEQRIETGSGSGWRGVARLCACRDLKPGATLGAAA